MNLTSKLNANLKTASALNGRLVFHMIPYRTLASLRQRNRLLDHLGATDLDAAEFVALTMATESVDYTSDDRDPVYIQRLVEFIQHRTEDIVADWTAYQEYVSVEAIELWDNAHTATRDQVIKLDSLLPSADPKDTVPGEAVGAGLNGSAPHSKQLIKS